MLNTIIQKNKFTNILYILVGTLVLGLGAVLNPINHYITGLLLMISAVVLYFYIVICVAQKNWLDIRAVFTGVWLFTIGLASLRLLDYQEPWQAMTWIYNALAYMMFQIGAIFGEVVWEKIYRKLKNVKCKHFYFEMKENRLFGICVVVTIIGILCFVANVCIRGYIPFFSSDDSAYVQFYTKFYLFAVATTMVSSLCYYCIKTQKIALWKKVVLVLCIVYETFLFPTLVVSRGTFLTSALSLAATIFYLNKRKLWVFISSMIVILGAYVLMSSARGYTNEQLNAFFEPSHIQVSPGGEEGEEGTDGSDGMSGTVFVLPSKISFIYSYLTVSHDNFNEAVQNATEYTYGIRQLQPFNVILRISAIEEILDESEYHFVRPHLNTANLISDSYYDLRGFGIVVFMLLWGCVFAVIQACCIKKNGPFALWTLGNTMTPVVLCFFVSWMSIFSQWMHWGTGLVLWVLTCIHFRKNK